MSVQSEIARITARVGGSFGAVEAFGVDVLNSTLDDLPGKIAEIADKVLYNSGTYIEIDTNRNINALTCDLEDSVTYIRFYTIATGEVKSIRHANVNMYTRDNTSDPGSTIYRDIKYVIETSDHTYYMISSQASDGVLMYFYSSTVNFFLYINPSTNQVNISADIYNLDPTYTLGTISNIRPGGLATSQNTKDYIDNKVSLIDSINQADFASSLDKQLLHKRLTKTYNSAGMSLFLLADATSWYNNTKGGAETYGFTGTAYVSKADGTIKDDVILITCRGSYRNPSSAANNLNYLLLTTTNNVVQPCLVLYLNAYYLAIKVLSTTLVLDLFGVFYNCSDSIVELPGTTESTCADVTFITDYTILQVADSDKLDGYHASDFLKLSGGTMTGNLALNGNKLCLLDNSSYSSRSYINASTSTADTTLLFPTKLHLSGETGASIDLTSISNIAPASGTTTTIGTSALPFSSMYASNGFYQTSDINKKNVHEEISLEKAYDLIDKCSTVLYDLKDDELHKELIGMIALEVEEFFPEIVITSDDGSKSLDYSRLTVIVFRVLKDIISRLSKLENV